MAQKETVNTFTGGMVMDTHPLTTPNNVLTNCLNGTLVTFNGNEMILQNDLGNTKIESKVNGDCVKLPEGFVPVGTAELGGIIYVTSFNPETKECQIGSFPSPERNQDGDNNNTKSFDENKLLAGNAITASNVDFQLLITSYIKLDLIDKVLYSGDSFVINSTDPLNDNLNYKLISVTDDGNIYELNFNGLGKNNYYTAPSCGKLAMIISPKKLNTLSCTYSNLREGGSYQNLQGTAEDSNALEVYSIPDHKVSDQIIVCTYKYYERDLGSGTAFVQTGTDETYYLNSKFIEVTNPDNLDDFQTLENYNNSVLLEDSNGVSYRFDDGFFVIMDNQNQSQSEDVDTPVVEVENNKFKVVQTAVYKKWVSSNNWTVDLDFSWQNENKEGLVVSNLNSIIIHTAQGNTLYPITETNKQKIILSGLTENLNHNIEIKYYPVINVTNQLRGYISELSQNIIIDTSLKEGDVKLGLWKYYYSKDTINLYYGLVGLLGKDQHINSITIYATEYKTGNTTKIEIESVKNKESFLGSFYKEILLGEKLLYNKLYAVEIKIETDYKGYISEYRWLYTNDVFNDKFNDGNILDYNKEKISLKNLKISLDIEDSDVPIEANLIIPDSFDITSEEADYKYEDYKTYGYTRNGYSNIECSYSLVYSSENELFEIDSSQIVSLLNDVKGTNLECNFGYTSEEDLVLNSYPGLKEEPSNMKPIWETPKAYEKYTDFIEVEKVNDKLVFNGRIYNKIKGTVGKDTFEGPDIYSPLVWNRTTAFEHDLEWNDDLGMLVPKYYLTLEIYPNIIFYLDADSSIIKDCRSAHKGSIGLYKVNLIKTEDNKIKLQYGDLSFDDITNKYCSKSENTSRGNLNDINSEVGSNIVESAYFNLKNRGISNYSIVPVIFTKPTGALKDIGGSSYMRGDYGENRSWDGITFSGLTPGNSDYFPTGRNFNKKGSEQDITNSKIYLAYAIFDSTDSNKKVYFLQDSNKPCLTVNNFNLVGILLFNILSQIYIRTGKSGLKTYCYITDLMYQVDFEATFNIEADVTSIISSHQIVKDQDGFSNWTHKENLYIEKQTRFDKINTYKKVKAEDRLYDAYRNRDLEHVKTRNFINGKNFNGCITNIHVPQNNNSPFYILGQMSEDKYELTPANAQSLLKLKYNATITGVKNDELQYEFTALPSDKDLSSLINFNGTDFLLTSDAINNAQNAVSFNNYSAESINSRNSGSGDDYRYNAAKRYHVKATTCNIELSKLIIQGSL